jgi:hypothetical protein
MLVTCVTKTPKIALISNLEAHVPAAGVRAVGQLRAAIRNGLLIATAEPRQGPRTLALMPSYAVVKPLL